MSCDRHPGMPTDTEEGPERKRRPDSLRAADLLRPTFKRFLWNSYDHIGLLVLANLVWLALCLPVVTAPASTAGLLHLARKIADHKEVSLGDYFEGFRVHFVPALKAGVFSAVAALLLWANIDFYSHLGNWATVPGMLLAAAMIWLGGFVLLMHAHILPLIVGGERSLRTTLRKSALLTLDNLGFTVGITVQALSVAALCVLTGAGLVLALGSFLAVLLATGHRELLKKYSPDSDAAFEPHETRGLRDLLRPWESGKPR